MRSPFFIFFLLFLSFSFAVLGNAQVTVSASQVNVDSLAVAQKSTYLLDSMLHRGLGRATNNLHYFIIHHRTKPNVTPDFYLLLVLCLMLGAVRSLHPKFFGDVWRGFINPTLGNRQLKDLIQSASFPNLLMNLFSSIVLGLYLYYLLSIDVDWQFAKVPRGLMAGLLVLGAVIVFAMKYLLIQLSAWLFKQKQNGEQYSYTVFLVNKVLAMVLLPFVVAFAFAPSKWHFVLALISLIIIVAAYLLRYVRSWNIFAQIFQNSRFHFFMYLCAFEILPLAVLIKSVSMLF